MQVYAFTEAVNDTAVRFQLTVMADSVLVWIQQVDGAGGRGASKRGSMSRLAASMPATKGFDGLPAATVILGDHTDQSSERFAARLALRCRIAVFASVDLGDLADVGADLIYKRVYRELDRLHMIK